MLVSVEFRFRERQIPLDSDDPQRFDLPENWREARMSFAFESADGIQESPGEVDVDSAERRHLTVVSPREPINTYAPADYPVFDVLGESHAIGGPYLCTDPVSEGLVVFNGLINPPARMYFVEGEEMAHVGLWTGLRKVFFWWV